jgi:bacteriochlorophyll 4-vinyl reductase
LQRALETQTGTRTATDSLHSAGYDTGGRVFESLLRSLPRPVDAIAEKAFWSSTSRYFERRGWGKLTHTSPHPGIGMLTSSDWAEADGRREPQPVCSFSVGVFAHLLTQVAAEPVAVLEVSCRAHGEPECRFAFGSVALIQNLQGRLLEGHGFDQALAEL